jgi:excinuclease UvrABC nuclease subunit
MKKNILEELPWIWPKTRKKINEEFGSIYELKNIERNKLEKVLNKRQIETLEDHWII